MPEKHAKNSTFRPIFVRYSLPAVREEKFDPMKRFYILFMLAVAGSLFFYGCSKDDAVVPRIELYQAGNTVRP